MNSELTVGAGKLPNPAAMELHRQWEPLARRLARCLADPAEREDLEQIARFALWQAAERFDPARGNQFSTFAVPTIVGALRRYLRDRSLSVRIPRRWWEQRPRLKRMADVLTQTLGREPSIAELAAQLAMSEEDVAGAMAAQNILYPISLDERPESQKGDETEALAGRIGAIDPRFEAAELRVIVHHAMEGLPSDQRDLLRRRYFQDQTPQEVARQVGVSRMEIARMERRALAWLRQELREAFTGGTKGPLL